MSRSKNTKHALKDPAWWRRMHNRKFRAFWRQSLREGEYCFLGHPHRWPLHDYYW